MAATRRVPVPRQKLYCYRCGKVWEPEGGEPPRLCPRCRSSQWDVPVLRDAVCTACGHRWQRTDIREKCPACGAGSSVPGMLHCNQCDHDWLPRSDSRPERCPSCRSSRWDEERDHTFTCYRCGNVWRNRTDHPERCPSCRSLKWDVPAYKLQCRRCGHRWTTRGGKTSEDVRICPSCKSDKWNEPPSIQTCASCGRFFISRKESGTPRCPSCKSKNVQEDRCCGFCGFEWSTFEKRDVCPRCGKDASDASTTSIDIWTDGRFLLKYVFTDGMAFIYLWRDGIPVITIYLHDLLRRLDVTVNHVMSMFANPDYDDTWRMLAEDMYGHRDDYLGDVAFLSKRLNIGIQDARILAIHFKGMGPEAIAMRFKVPLDTVRAAFDRIMAAFVDNGIVVDDTVFTDDAMSYYERSAEIDPVFRAVVPRLFLPVS